MPAPPRPVPFGPSPDAVPKLLVLLFGLAWFIRFRLRRYPRLRARIYPWTLAVAGSLLLLATNLGPGDSRFGPGLHAVKVVLVLALLVYTAIDVWRTLQVTRPAPILGREARRR